MQEGHTGSNAVQTPAEAAPMTVSRMGAFTALAALEEAPHCFRVIPDAAQVHCLESGRLGNLLFPCWNLKHPRALLTSAAFK